MKGSSAVSQPCLFTADFGFTCYGPYELGKAYNFPSNLSGKGQTIVVVDAYGSPTIQDDLASFDSYFGIPDPTSFSIVQAPGTGATGSGDTDGWAVETSLDVEYAHAMAPGARIVLAVAASDDNNDLNLAEARILPRYPGAIVSQSFGDWETDPTAGSSISDEHKIFVLATLLHETLVASTGDAGATFTQFTGTTSPALAGYPASDPLVTAVGGTEGLPYPDGLFQNGGYGGEQTWNEGDFDAATGGAPSVLFRAPFYQLGVTGNRMRTIPDVSLNAAIDGGVEVFASPFIYLVGGTSAGSPQWSAAFALLNEARARSGRGPIGFVNDNLYRIGRDRARYARGFHDITIGDNALDSTTGFPATRGYDLATGWGTPDVTNLISELVQAPSGGPFDVGLFSAPQPTNGHGHRQHKPHTMSPG